MKHWSTVTDNAFNKAWKISCPTCVNSILWYKKQCHECETAVERMYSESDKIMKFLDTEIKLGLSDIKTIERVKWYFETYFEQFKKK